MFDTKAKTIKDAAMLEVRHKYAVMHGWHESLSGGGSWSMRPFMQGKYEIVSSDQGKYYVYAYENPGFGPIFRRLQTLEEYYKSRYGN
jgi:hypothetical protein